MKNFFQELVGSFFTKKDFIFVGCCITYGSWKVRQRYQIFLFPFGNVGDTLCTELLCFDLYLKKFGKEQKSFYADTSA